MADLDLFAGVQDIARCAACPGYTYNSVQGNERYFPYPVVFGSSMSISKYSSFRENQDDRSLDMYGKTRIQVEKREFV